MKIEQIHAPDLFRSHCPLTSSPKPTPQLLHAQKLHCQVASSLPTPGLLCAEGCARSPQIALSPAFRALDTGLHFSVDIVRPALRLQERICEIFALGHLPCQFCMLACSLHAHLPSVSAMQCGRKWKCQCVSVCRSVSEGIFGKNPSQCFPEKRQQRGHCIVFTACFLI